MKRKYVEPDMKMEKYYVEDIITTSGVDSGDSDGGEDEGGWLDGWYS